VVGRVPCCWCLRLRKHDLAHPGLLRHRVSVLSAPERRTDDCRHLVQPSGGVLVLYGVAATWVGQPGGYRGRPALPIRRRWRRVPS
jgi:hypothetical protein